MHDGHRTLESEATIINLSNARLPDTPLNGVGQIFKKFASFENIVIDKLSALLEIVDSNSSVLVTGSYRNNPANLRQTSDIDMIILSKSLRSGSTYIEFLENLKDLSRAFKDSTQLTPVFFTTAAAENNFIYMARKERSLDGVVPVHFLYYKDENELFHLEPLGLATRLFISSKVIKGKDQYSVTPNGNKTTVSENIRWDIERSIAELILNDGVIERDWLFSNFNNSVYISIRRNTDALGLEGSSVKSVLDYFDPSGDLLERFGPHFAIRNNINLVSETNEKELLDGPLRFLEILERRSLHH